MLTDGIDSPGRVKSMQFAGMMSKSSSYIGFVETLNKKSHLGNNTHTTLVMSEVIIIGHLYNRPCEVCDVTLPLFALSILFRIHFLQHAYKV